MNRKRLRFGIISDSYYIEEWQKNCLEKMIGIKMSMRDC